MATFATRKHPRLVVKFGRHGTVKFEDGTVEVDGEQAERLAEFASRHPEYGIEVTEGEVTVRVDRETPKQRAQREARERGLDDSGTIAEIQARIDEHDNSEPEGNDNPGDDDEDDLDDEDGDPFADPQAQDD